MELVSLPVFGVCGYSGSGKTTLLEKVLPRLVRRGLRIAVLKHDVHGLDRDRPGKDSDRLFGTGVDVIACGPGESLVRRRDWEDSPIECEIAGLVDRYDLVLLEGFKRLRCRKVWLSKPAEASPPEELGPFDAVLPWDSNRAEALEPLLASFVEDATRRVPVFGCILIGGRSTRMGSPKHLLPSREDAGQTWLHRTIRVLEPSCRQIAIAGRGTVPEDLQHLPRLPDPPGIAGPAAGLMAAMCWAPRVSWLLAACDLPQATQQAVAWILSHRAPGIWAVLPRTGNGEIEPLLAWYDPRARADVERMAASGHRGLRSLAEHPKALIAAVPPELADAWQDADTPQAIRARGSSIR